MGHIASIPCLVCGGQSTVHHVTASIHGGRIARSNKRVAPLCCIHHQKAFDPLAGDPVSVEGLSHRGFYDKYGIDLLLWADEEWNSHHPEDAL